MLKCKVGGYKPSLNGEWSLRGVYERKHRLAGLVCSTVRRGALSCTRRQGSFACIPPEDHSLVCHVWSFFLPFWGYQHFFLSQIAREKTTILSCSTPPIGRRSALAKSIALRKRAWTAIKSVPKTFLFFRSRPTAFLWVRCSASLICRRKMNVGSFGTFFRPSFLVVRLGVFRTAL